MFIQTETTPNPHSLKFLPQRIVLAEGSAEFKDTASAATSPLASKLLSLDGVSSVFFGHDFISVTQDSTDWSELKPVILGTIMEHFSQNLPVIIEQSSDDTSTNAEFFAPEDLETVETIKELLELRVKPFVNQDGGDITFKGFKDGIVYLHMQGACAGCPSSTLTLKHGIENLLKHFVPEVLGVEQI